MVAAATLRQSGLEFALELEAIRPSVASLALTGASDQFALVAMPSGVGEDTVALRLACRSIAVKGAATWIGKDAAPSVESLLQRATKAMRARTCWGSASRRSTPSSRIEPDWGS